MSGFGHQPFKPSFGGKVIVPGCSDKSSRTKLQEKSQGGPKLTTYARTAAALEAYWAQRAAAGSAPVGPGLPGGEKALAYRTREACWKDSVHLKHHAGVEVPEWQGVPADIEDKETVRTRGITGFTGKQPQPGCSKPPAPAPDTSRWVAINAFDEPKPRVKGIVGYTGHQPPSPVKSAGQGAAAGTRGTNPDTQTADEVGTGPDIKTAWGPAASSGIAAQQQQQQQYASAAAAHCGSDVPGNAGSAGCIDVRSDEAGGSYPGRPGSTASSCYSPRFFMNGEEVAADRMQQLQPPHSASAATQQQGAAWMSGQQCHQQQNDRQQKPAAVRPAAWSAGGPTQPHVAWGASSSTGCEQPGSSGSSRCYTGQGNARGGYKATASGTACISSCNTTPGQPGSSSGALAVQPVVSQLPRTRATSYAAAFSPAAGFNFQHYMDSLKLAGSMRPGSAAAAYSSYQQQRPGGMR